MVDSNDGGSGNLGVKFTADTSGQILGIRFYKASTNTGTHTGSLWSAGGQLLASANFSDESPSGWQTVPFSSPVSITAGNTYVASYFDPNGHYSFDAGGVRPSGRQPAAARALQQCQRQRPVQLQRDQQLPDEHLQRQQLLGRRRCSSRRSPDRSRTSPRPPDSNRQTSAGRRRPAAGSRPTRSRRSSAPRRRRRRP